MTAITHATVDELIASRGTTHGHWEKQARTAQSLKACIAIAQEPIRTLSKGQREALDMVCVKISRIVCGNPNEPDHWNDLEAYARLGRDSDPL